MEAGVIPIYQGDNKYILLIQFQIEGYRHKYPSPTHKLAVPITTVNIAYKIGNKSNNTAAKVSGQLCVIALYFLLCIGEYTLPRLTNQDNSTTRTIQFRVGDIGFCCNSSILPQQSPLHLLRKSDSSTMNITNHKNGHWCQLIYQEALTTGIP